MLRIGAVKVLGLETSCDETAAAVVEDGTRVRSDVIASQVAQHRPYGGVVPELASRHHLLNVMPVVRTALADAGLTLDDIDAVACTRGPGLVGALLVGVQVAKAIAYARGLDLVGVSHLDGHLTAVHLENADPPGFPHVALLVSGGHTQLIRVDGFGRYRLLGTTRDDAAGEAFDKVAKLVGLGYPGGVVIDRLAKSGDPRAVPLPRALPGRNLDFSFSGLKTAVRTWIQKQGVPEGQGLADLAASFQQAVCDPLVRKTVLAARREGVGAVQLSGGVAANSQLRRDLAAALGDEGIRLHVPPPVRCTDNAAMIAAAGFHRLARGERAGLDLNPEAQLPL
jgi:N6-L-threonylcarbamoyladenine synthase